MFALKTVILAFAAFAASAAAAPQSSMFPSEVNLRHAIDKCEQGPSQNQISCCNSEHNDLLSILDDLSLLGGQCQQLQIPINILAVADTTQTGVVCQGQIACCAGESVSIL